MQFEIYRFLLLDVSGLNISCRMNQINSWIALYYVLLLFILCSYFAITCFELTDLFSNHKNDSLKKIYRHCAVQYHVIFY